MSSPPPSGSLGLLAGYGYDDDDDEDEQEREERAKDENQAPAETQQPGNHGDNASGGSSDEQQQDQSERPELEGVDDADDRESDFAPPPAKRQRSASSSGGHFNFEISDDEAGGDGQRRYGDDEEEGEDEEEADRKSAGSDPPQQQQQQQRRRHRSKLSKVDSLVSYGLGAYESDEEEAEVEEADQVDSRKASPSQAGSSSDRVSGDPATKDADTGRQETDLTVEGEADENAATDLKEPPPPPPKVEADGPDADSETVSAELTDEDRTAARQKANRLLLSLSSGSQAGASQLTLPPPPLQALANRGVEQKIAGILQRQRHEPAFNPASLITKNKSYRNPSIYEKLMSYYGVDDRGTNFHPTVFDPYIWDKHSYYDSLLKVQVEAEKKRVGATSSGKSAAPAAALGEPSVQGMPSRGSSSALQPLMQLPAKKPQHHHRAGAAGHAEAGVADAITSGARRSKWDTAPAAGSSVGTFLRKKI